MSGLVLKLGPKERILINGAVIENGDRRTRFSVLTPNASILRLKDAIHPNEANTPVKRACYLAQLLLSGGVDEESVTSKLEEQISSLMYVFSDTNSHAHLKAATNALSQNIPYACLKALRQLLPLEETLLPGGR